MQKLAEVWLWDKLVGALAWATNTASATFEYTPEWVRTGVQIAPLHMPSQVDGTRIFHFPQLNRDTYKGLPACFADTLPDDFGNAVINAWLARNGRDPQSFNPLERLLYSGKRGMGALEYAPALRQAQNSNNKFELDSLIGMAQQVLDQRAGVSSQLHNAGNDDLTAILQVGTSAGGARAKALVAINKDRTEIRSGQVDAPEGFEHYLLKFDGIVEHGNNRETFGDPQGFGRMEYAYYLMAKAAGIAMTPCELLMDGERAHFLTQRFDRIGNHKLHYQSLCAMDHADFKMPGHYSYEQLFAVARQLRLTRAEAVEIYRRMVFNIIARNHDDHSKNFGFILPGPHAPWQLAPAFDIAYSYKPGSPWVNSHQLSVNGKRDNFVRDDLLVMAKLISNFTKEAKLIIQQTLDVVSQWESYSRTAEVPANLTHEIQKNLRLNL
ncbi:MULTISPECIES: type II toxin-antitoxin system HipA family toxin [Cellvibrio]|uniref:Serine/threonine-protein kinase HipA n=1 Tax=Cellvibrio fibrivorans TaxID=126350 RepID=A0ABU1V0V0_9GAMM|nr:type II toxin-antitoxin system HipA family toxin [Cellvibrio fibrivorans]MDR7090983.1 serine/threonine-protein kinase HipA [Cellvibrio fibrivorans]